MKEAKKEKHKMMQKLFNKIPGSKYMQDEWSRITSVLIYKNNEDIQEEDLVGIKTGLVNSLS